MLSPKGFIDTITLEFKSQENVVPPSLSSFSAAVAKKNLPKTPHGHMVSQIASQVWKFTKEKNREFLVYPHVTCWNPWIDYLDCLSNQSELSNFTRMLWAIINFGNGS